MYRLRRDDAVDPTDETINDTQTEEHENRRYRRDIDDVLIDSNDEPYRILGSIHDENSLLMNNDSTHKRDITSMRITQEAVKTVVSYNLVFFIETSEIFMKFFQEVYV